MKKIFVSLLSISAFSFLLTACTKSEPDPNNQKPTIEILRTLPAVTTDLVCEETHNNVLLAHPGETLEIEMKLRDDHGLSQYKIEIHENADCHDHGDRPLSEWYYSNVVDLSGTESTKTEIISIPDDADMAPYHIEIKLIDESGMESDELEYNLVLE